MADEARVKRALALLDALETYEKRDEDDSPWPMQRDLEAIWQDGITYGMQQLGAVMNVTGWDADGASESVEGDVRHEIGSILRKVAERRVLAVRGSWGAPGFEACVEGELSHLCGW